MRRLISLAILIFSFAFGQTAWSASEGLLKVNINADDAATLADVLDGVGLKKAQAIVAYREANGAFTDPAELIKVKGIGEVTVSANMERIEVEDETP